MSTYDGNFKSYLCYYYLLFMYLYCANINIIYIFSWIVPLLNSSAVTHLII